MKLTDDPLALFAEAATSVVGRVGAFFFAAWLSTFTVALVFFAQSIESLRVHLSLSYESHWPIRVWVFLAVWSGLLILFLVSSWLRFRKERAARRRSSLSPC
jgi:uncharacterized integral membrane protein